MTSYQQITTLSYALNLSSLEYSERVYEWMTDGPKYLWTHYFNVVSSLVKEYNDKPCKVTVFSWNGKYLIKLEKGPFEQTYKVSEMDVLEQELEEILSDSFFEKVDEVFELMGQNLRTGLQNL